MRKEIIIRVQTSAEKGACCKAIKVAAGVKGVESVTITGEDRNLLLVIGIGVDSNRLTKKLRQKVGHAEVVELRTVDAAANELVDRGPAEHAYRYNSGPGPYKQHQQHNHAAGRDHYYSAGGGGYPRDHYLPSPYKHQQHAGGSTTYAPPTGGRDYYYGGGGGGGGGGGYYPAQYQQQQHFYQPPPANMPTVVHHEYANDPNSCSIM